MHTDTTAPCSTLRDLAVALGTNPRHIQGPGGNISVKLGDVLWVKSSGTWLRDARDKSIFSALDWRKMKSASLEEISVGNGAGFLLDARVNSGLRPSIEACLHALLPHRFVVHTHSTPVIAATTHDRGKDAIVRALSGRNWVQVPYAQPGIDLAQAIGKAIRRWRKRSGRANVAPDIIVLENHGLVLGAESPDSILNDLEVLCDALTVESGRSTFVAARIPEPFQAPSAYRLAPDMECHHLAFDDDLRAKAVRGALYPDHVVFLGSGISVRDDSPDLWPANGSPVVLSARFGAFVRRDAKDVAVIMLRCLADVLMQTPRNADLIYLAEDEVSKLKNWEAEAFRTGLQH